MVTNFLKTLQRAAARRWYGWKIFAGDSDKGPNVNPSQVFAMYYNFGVTESCQSPWLCFGTGTPVLTEGVVRVEDNQMMLLDQPLTLPFDISFKLRINGAN